MATHRYESRLRWTGSTGLGWDHYAREHSVTAPPAEQELRVTTGESKGDPAALNPEQAASSCQMRITEITLRPRITVQGDATEERIRRLVDQAHGHCFVANSLNSAMVINPTIEHR